MRTDDRVLRRFAHVLPREFRERVFEPALADIRLDELTRRRPFARLILAAECLRLGLPQYVWARRRPTKLGITLAIAATVAVGVIVGVRLRYAAQWKTEATRAHSERAPSR
jgi:hypothetical protein